jgi:outer membrane protein assembly factor BamD (BamD/ComL family)
MLLGFRLSGPILLLAAATASAPLQCARTHPSGEAPERRTEDDAAEVLYTLAEKFKAEGNLGARAETLRFLMARYPTSRFAESARIDLEPARPRP